MEAKEAQNQIQQMMNFILCEAKDKADEINTKGLEEFSIEKFRLVNQQKEKIRQEYAKKAKQVETQCAIARSMAINKSRLEKIKARQEAITKISKDVQSSLVNSLKQEAAGKSFLTKSIVQGLLMLLEDEVIIVCRQSDKPLVEACMSQAANDYAAVIQKEAGIAKKCKLAVSSEFLPPSCLGGVKLACQNGTITIDNTIDARLQLVLEQDKPKIRALLFPLK
eukprot:gnl/TRDRNA2_/TRDRNA2_92068_c0_seq2.p1 gnl/TRDRNA2_/TRDRNA2_92068_c0~~gnl/TRDRNA2_/TRDRNA2_92068_c0_seq2.p1  ORF type:complete len:223 (+),score=85.67 gnl/TRDRNA2_/TRDRNA2_92068_c0_seq2:113-781(+)